MRGVIIGGSIGMIASWFGYEPVKAFSWASSAASSPQAPRSWPTGCARN